jgi:dTDP-4-dehydrorhamnose reductase
MTKVLVLGGDGMLGHCLHDYLVRQGKWEVGKTRRGDFDVANGEALHSCLSLFKPDVVVNCVGIVRSRIKAGEFHLPTVIHVNAAFPHQLAVMCRWSNARLIHISTDCVFSGLEGYYKEDDAPCPSDIYGMTKLLGEVTDSENTITIRTSMIGREQYSNRRGLLEWFLSQVGMVYGYENHRWSGLTTLELSRVIELLIEDGEGEHGLYHVSGPPITKHDLLKLVKDRLKLPIHLAPMGGPVVDMTLDSSRFQSEFGWVAPPWSRMIDEI